MDQGVAPVDDVAEPWPLLSSTAEAADTVKDDGTEEPPPMTPPDVKVARRLAKGKGPAAEENGAAVAATGTTLAETQAKEGTDNPVALAAATQLTIATPPPPSAEGTYFLKDILWLDPAAVRHTDQTRPEGRIVKILMQNANGPCPLISICNALILRGEMELPAHKMSVDYDYLVSLLGERLLTKVGGASAESEFSAIMEAMPRLQTGLDVNVLFDGVFDFDRTPEMQIFQWLGVQLCHCWLPDPADPALYDVVHGHTYDRLVEMVVAGQEASLKLKQGALGGALGTPEASDSGAGGAGTSAAAGADTLATLEREVRLGEKVEQFLELSRSQLTYYGLQMLGSSLPPNSIVVLFRNNHFATVFKRQVDSRANDKPASASGTNKPDFIDRMSDLLLGSDAEVLPNSGHRFVGEYELLLLATDQGYAEKRELVWETLANHDGDSVFLTGNYDEYRPQQNSPLYERVERRRSSQQPDTTAPDLKLPAATANNAIKSRLLPTSAVDATTSDSQTAALLTQLANEDRAARQQLTNSTPSSAEHRIRQPTTQASDAQAASTQETRDRQLAVQLQDAEYLAMQQQGAQSQSSRWRVGAEKCTVM